MTPEERALQLLKDFMADQMPIDVAIMCVDHILDAIMGCEMEDDEAKDVIGYWQEVRQKLAE